MVQLITSSPHSSLPLLVIRHTTRETAPSLGKNKFDVVHTLGPQIEEVWLDILRAKQNGWQFADNIFRLTSFKENFCIVNPRLYKGFISQWITNSGDGLVLLEILQICEPTTFDALKNLVLFKMSSNEWKLIKNIKKTKENKVIKKMVQWWPCLGLKHVWHWHLKCYILIVLICFIESLAYNGATPHSQINAHGNDKKL